MKTLKYVGKFTAEERETILRYDSFEKQWIMDSNIPKHFNKAMRQGWTPISQTVYEDGTVCAMELIAAERAITIKTPIKREFSEERRQKLKENCPFKKQ